MLTWYFLSGVICSFSVWRGKNKTLKPFLGCDHVSVTYLRQKKPVQKKKHLHITDALSSFHYYSKMQNPYLSHVCSLSACQALVPGVEVFWEVSSQDAQQFQMMTRNTWKSKPKANRTNRLNLFWNTFGKWNKKGGSSAVYVKSLFAEGSNAPQTRVDSLPQRLSEASTA